MLRNWSSLESRSKDCQYISNSADSGGAAALTADTLLINGCLFDGNSVLDDGGALSLGPATGTVSNCTFTNNAADQDGGALFMMDQFGTGLHPRVQSCVFQSNSAGTASIDGEGGAIVIATGVPDPSNPSLISQCTFSENTATFAGGALRNRAELVLEQCEFAGNSAPLGSAVYNGSRPCVA